MLCYNKNIEIINGILTFKSFLVYIKNRYLLTQKMFYYAETGLDGKDEFFIR